jgi:hypothetical protein
MATRKTSARAKNKKATEKTVKKAVLQIKEYDIEYLLACKAKYNPRKISGEQQAGLRLSMTKFGYVQNIIFNEKTETVVSGHQRLDILHAEGYERVEVHVVNLSEEQEKQLNVAMNASTISGDFTAGINEMIEDILKEDPELYDLANLGSLMVLDEDEEKPEKKNDDKEGVPGMDLLPYEHYDCMLVVFKNVDDYLYLSSALGLDEKRVISAPMVKNKRLGKVRAVAADKLLALIEGGNEGAIDIILDDLEDIKGL